jgi:hypothetical protein
MKRKGILLIVFTMLVATAGVVYAHWTSTLDVGADVHTGGIQAMWIDAFTDDDGVPNDPYDSGDYGGGTLFSYWPEMAGPDAPESSDDPGAPMAGYRYDKDVGGCWAFAEGSFLGVHASNVYPSYHCTVYSTFKADPEHGATVPTKVQRIKMRVMRAPFCWWVETGPDGEGYEECEGDGQEWIDITHELQPYPTQYGMGAAWPGYNEDFSFPEDYGFLWDTIEGFGCGRQLDPGQEVMTTNYFHIGERAPQHHPFYVEQQLEFINWNEYEELPEGCFYTFDGEPLFYYP